MGHHRSRSRPAPAGPHRAPGRPSTALPRPGPRRTSTPPSTPTTTPRRLQFALSARDYAAEVLSDPTSTPAEMQYAGYYFADAEAIIAQLANPDAA